MANTASNMLPLGSEATDFKLIDTISNEVLSLEQLKGEKATVIVFICNHCPFVIHVNHELIRMAQEYKEKGVGFIAISSNDSVNYPQDGPEMMKKVALDLSYPFPYLYDESQEVAKAYQAACTPDNYVFDKDLKLVYRGQIDNSRPGNGVPVSGTDLREALDLLLAGKTLHGQQKPSMGCNIKWKA
ncbi:thioredoxin family protein [Lutimonas halocynthiae]|uniref:thioredoxin family protein n=1 Tax=Lutimonas halocynthiae TaxID=1446477 RepID=UPI0025B3D1C2|nr:thioredoxin family protein [Lutimonas halocynthiae]MDN3643729.1 thioredoxin family protein [Lutimonas halocynthiae]